MFEHENKGMRKTVLFIYKLVEEYNNSVSYSLVTKPKWVTISCEMFYEHTLKHGAVFHGRVITIEISHEE
jgi:hypothetical protein